MKIVWLTFLARRHESERETERERERESCVKLDSNLNPGHAAT